MLDEYDKSEEALLTAIKLQKEDDNKSKTHYVLGLTLLEKNNFEEAIKAFEMAIKLNNTYDDIAEEKIKDCNLKIQERNKNAASYNNVKEFDETFAHIRKKLGI